MLLMLITRPALSALSEADLGATDETITLVENDADQRIFEFRQNGVLMMIKVIPKSGRPYYLVPATGQAHFTDLTDQKHLYPQWTLIEW
tara:strand:+ start:2296 stop:2562 length:267 start_codon:yes stop_codon:yes gene_type:complete